MEESQFKRCFTQADMKEIKIKNFTETEKGTYIVSIGNGVSKEFVNKKHCRKFLSDTGRYLTLKLFEANTIYLQLLTHYRRNWFYFDHNKDPGFQLFEADRACKRNLDNIGELFELLVKRGGYPNGNTFVFTHFRNSFTNMKLVIADLQELHRTKSNAVDVHDLQAIYLRVLYLEKEVLLFDGTFTKEILDADEIFTRNRMKAV